MTFAQLLHYYYVGSEYEIERMNLQAMATLMMSSGRLPSKRMPESDKPDRAGIKTMLARKG